jgi:AAA+ ATPase superfamily predicted ATPase
LHNGDDVNFVNRTAELARLDGLLEPAEGGLGILWGRRRIGKTRLLLEWCRKRQGLYTVADLSAPAIHRRYLAEAVATVLKGFDQVVYPDWRALLNRLAQDSLAQGWRGPLVFDELPYWISASPELPSVLQRWLDHEAKTARLVVVLAGSSQRMLQGLALDATSPLYGRARAAWALGPLEAGHIVRTLHLPNAPAGVMAYALWGGVPRYWELAEPFGHNLEAALDACVLDPAGPLHDEPDRLLLDELPSANALRPLLDAIGLGAHKLTVIAARIGRPPTALSRSLVRLQELGLVQRQVPFGESERSGKRALYQMADPFFRAWFRLVAPHRGFLAVARAEQRRALWKQHEPGLVSETWEELCRMAATRLPLASAANTLPVWLPAQRFWHGNGPEWDIVARSADGRQQLLGEAKWHRGRDVKKTVRAAVAALLAKGRPPVREIADADVVRVVLVPDATPGVEQGVHVVNAEMVLRALGPQPS